MNYRTLFALSAAVVMTVSAAPAGTLLPQAGPGESITSFDWGADGALYYATGQSDYSPGLTVYRHAGGTSTPIYHDPAVFAGTRVTAIGGGIYFNDGGDMSRWTYDYFRYDTQAGGSPEALDLGGDYWGLATRDGADLWAAGGWSSAIYRTALDSAGLPLTTPLESLGVIGGSSGPICFDSAGNLYYAQGYAATPAVYRFSAAEVEAAIAGDTLLDPAGQVWTTIDGGFAGVSGMAVGPDGDLYLTATSWTIPGELRRYAVGPDGSAGGYDVLATGAGMGTVRVHDGGVYYNDAAGVAAVPEPATLMVTAVGFGGLGRYVRRRGNR